MVIVTMKMMSFQGGGVQESSAVFQDSQDFLKQVWWSEQNIPALPGKLKKICNVIVMPLFSVV